MASHVGNSKFIEFGHSNLDNYPTCCSAGRLDVIDITLGFFGLLTYVLHGPESFLRR